MKLQTSIKKNIETLKFINENFGTTGRYEYVNELSATYMGKTIEHEKAYGIFIFAKGVFLKHYYDEKATFTPGEVLLSLAVDIKELPYNSKTKEKLLNALNGIIEIELENRKAKI